MSLHFFLENRAHQLARLCTGDARKVELLSQTARGKQPPELLEFCDLLARVCEVGHAGSADLSQQQRDDLQYFEQAIVRLRFSADESVKQPVVQLIKAIFADADYFSGLKPLPQYTDAFAYELLFPSWLNLLTATMLPRADSGKPRVEGRRQGVLFEFLGKLHASGAEDESRLVGLLTFVARRFDAPLCEDLLHRTVELYQKLGPSLLDRLDSIQDSCKTARQFAQRLADYLTVRHSMERWPPTSEYPIAYRRPLLRVLPQGIVELLREYDESQDAWEEFFQIAEPLVLLINSDQLLTSEFIDVLNSRPREAAHLLALVIRGDKQGPWVLCAEGQCCLADTMLRESSLRLAEDDGRLSAFATRVASRLAGFGEPTLKHFHRHFVEDEANRQTLLRACLSESALQTLTASTLERASAVSDRDRFLAWLSCAAVISPDAAVASAKNALLAIEAVMQNRSIGNKELSDLLDDMQTNPSQALHALANPMMAVRGKSPRLAALYMTLNEVAQTYVETGRAQNFSVVRAKYAALAKLG